MPTSMFCGLPVTEMTEPAFAPIARPIRYGVGLTRSGPSAASSTGVTTRQIVSFTNRADRSPPPTTDRKSTRLNSSHVSISYAVFCLKKKKNKYTQIQQNKEKN